MYQSLGRYEITGYACSRRDQVFKVRSHCLIRRLQPFPLHFRPFAMLYLSLSCNERIAAHASKAVAFPVSPAAIVSTENVNDRLTVRDKNATMALHILRTLADSSIPFVETVKCAGFSSPIKTRGLRGAG